MLASKDGLYARLRSGTRLLHEQLESVVAIERRIQTRRGYIQHLMQLWALHTTVESALGRLTFEPAGFEYPSPYRARLLEIDLAHLGVPAAALAEMRNVPPPRLPSIAAGLGCVYVVEGSAKGARAILPHVKASLGLDAQSGASYFAGGGQEAAHLWHAALAAIGAIAPRSDDGDAALSAAIATFEMFREGLLAPTPMLNRADELQFGDS